MLASARAVSNKAGNLPSRSRIRYCTEMVCILEVHDEVPHDRDCFDKASKCASNIDVFDIR